MKSLLLLITSLGAVIAGDCNSDTCASAVANPRPFHTDCSTFMATTIASTVVPATSTSTITRFNNNQDEPTTTPPPAKLLTPDNSNLYTVTSTDVPSWAVAACGSDKKGDDRKQEIMGNFRSACSCQGVSPTTISVATATVTSVEYLPTTVSDFFLQVVFSDGTGILLLENITSSSSDPDSRNHLKLDGNSSAPALLALTPDHRLRLESQGKLSILDTLLSQEQTLPAPLAFASNGSYGSVRPIGFHIFATEVNEYVASVVPFSHTEDTLDGMIGPENSLANMTVVVSCDGGVCIGTPSWQKEMFDAGNDTSKDGRYHLVQLQVLPYY